MYSTRPLIAYPSSHLIFFGQGWRARAAYYVYMLAPRLLRALPNLPGLAPQLRMFDLAAAGLPAVGLLSDSEVCAEVPAAHWAWCASLQCRFQTRLDSSQVCKHAQQNVVPLDKSASLFCSSLL